MKKVAALVWIAIVILLSCSKEKSFEGETTNIVNTDSLLVRVVYGSSSDSLVQSYGYDASRRLISQTFVAVSGPDTYHEQVIIRRNGQGIIQQVVQRSDVLSANGLDSIVFNVKYNTSTSRYTSKVAYFNYQGFPVSDSVVYSYNGAGKINRAESFFGIPQFNAMSEARKTEFTYSGNNMNNTKTYDYDTTTGAYHLSYEHTIEYDGSINPVSLGAEAIVMSESVFSVINNFISGEATLFSVNNITKDTYNDYENTSNNEQISLMYNYNTRRKPASGTGTYQSGGSFPVFYYYQ